MPSKKKMQLPNLPFRPLALKLAGDQQLLVDIPKSEQRLELAAARLTHSYGGVMTNMELGHMCDVGHECITRWFKTGIRWQKGEDLCDRFGFHPVEVWPDYYRILADAELEFIFGMKIDDAVDDRIMEKTGGK